MRESGWMTFSMVMVLKYGPMVEYMKANIKKVKRMERHIINLQMERHTKVIFLKIRFMVSETINGLMAAPK